MNRGKRNCLGRRAAGMTLKNLKIRGSRRRTTAICPAIINAASTKNSIVFYDRSTIKTCVNRCACSNFSSSVCSVLVVFKKVGANCPQIIIKSTDLTFSGKKYGSQHLRRSKRQHLRPNKWHVHTNTANLGSAYRPVGINERNCAANFDYILNRVKAVTRRKTLVCDYWIVNIFSSLDVPWSSCIRHAWP